MATRKNPVKDRNQPDAPAQTIAVAPDLNMYIDPDQTWLRGENCRKNSLHGENVIFTAPPGYGKSNMVKRLPLRLIETHQNYQVCFMDLLSITSRDSFLSLLRKRRFAIRQSRRNFAEFLARTMQKTISYRSRNKCETKENQITPLHKQYSEYGTLPGIRRIPKGIAFHEKKAKKLCSIFFTVTTGS